MNIIRLNNDRLEYVDSDIEFLDLIEQEIGEDAVEYIKNNMLMEDEIKDMESELESLQDDIDELNEEKEILENRIKELEQEQDVPVDRILSHKLFKVIAEVNKLTDLSKSKKVEEQKQKIANMLKEIVDNVNIK